jgi:hypothetical protein
LGDSFVPVEDWLIASSSIESGTYSLPLDGLGERLDPASALWVGARPLVVSSAIVSATSLNTIPARAARVGKSEIAVRELMVLNQRHKMSIDKPAIRARIGAVGRDNKGSGSTTLTTYLLLDGDSKSVVERHVIWMNDCFVFVLFKNIVP